MEPQPEQMHPRARQLLDYWESIRPAPNVLPGRENFQPAAVAPLLASLSLLDVFRNPLRFRYRVVGSSLTVAGYSARAGDWFDEVVPPLPRGERPAEPMIEVVHSGRPSWVLAPPRMPQVRGVAEIERLILPLARDGRTVDMLLNLTLYHSRSRRVL